MEKEKRIKIEVMLIKQGRGYSVVITSLSLEAFKMHLDGAVNSLVCIQCLTVFKQQVALEDLVRVIILIQ